VLTDISERKDHEERIRFLAQNDVLTGLPNRTVYRDRVTQAIAQAQRSGAHVAVMFLDIDHFKDINESLGHEVGDVVLKAAAQRLRGCLRAGDTAARQGGDEFVICLPTLAEASQAIAIAEKLLDALAPADPGRRQGAARARQHRHQPVPGRRRRRRCADARGRRGDVPREAERPRHLPLLHRRAEPDRAAPPRARQPLYEALQHGEFVMHYQPKVDLRSGRVFGAEALIRWPQADGSFIGPQEFIRVAEETGLIGPLGEWILRVACTEARTGTRRATATSASRSTCRRSSCCGRAFRSSRRTCCARPGCRPRRSSSRSPRVC
jgi:diguanylate cyclase (GGDEF)-like protein